MESLLSILNEILETNSIKIVAEHLNVTVSTIKRWQLLKNVPEQYRFDLMGFSSREIDYSQFSFREKDQFFTADNVAKYCLDTFKKKLEELGIEEEKFNYIEPSAGSGAFLKILPEERRIGLDIEPRDSEIVKADFLSWSTDVTNNIVIGNPPFGLRGHTALKFINHSSKFADFVAFILPQLFESDGKGTPRSRVEGLNLIHSEKIDSKFYDPNGKEIIVNTIFQIWAKNFSFIKNKSSCKQYIKIYSLSDGGSPASTRNKDMIGKCDIYIPSTCFGSDKMKVYSSFEDLPGKKGYGIVALKENEKVIETLKTTDWVEKSFKSTNSAFNLRSSIIEEVLINNNFEDV